MRFLVVGCGGIGGIVAAHLFEQRLDVTALTTNALIADAIEAHGFRVRGDQAPAGAVRGSAVRKLPASTAPFDYVLLCTQPPGHRIEDLANLVGSIADPPKIEKRCQAQKANRGGITNECHHQNDKSGECP